MRFKNRYLLVELLWENPSCASSISHKALRRACKDSVLSCFGDFGWGKVKTGFNIKYYNPVTSVAILRCSRADHGIVEASLSFITTITNNRVTIRTVNTSGTIRSCREHAIEYTKRTLLAMQKRPDLDSSLKRSIDNMLKKGSEEKQINNLVAM